MALTPARVAGLSLTYPEVGATAGPLPAGYSHLDLRHRIGRGRAWFDEAAHRLRTWQMHRRAGLLVEVDGPVAIERSAVVRIRLGPVLIDAPVRVVAAVDEPNRAGFAYGTLPGHPETGEERFLVIIDEDGSVWAHIRAFSRPARWFTRLGGPFASTMQRSVTRRYVAALTQP